MTEPTPDIDYIADFLTDDDQQRLFDAILATSPLEVHEVVVFGKRHPTPRRVAWHADGGRTYRYSGQAHAAAPWTPALREIRARLLERLGRDFDSVLINHYRDGRDAMGFHADDEPIFGPRPVIASVSLGAARRFVFKHREIRGARRELVLAPGSLLVMRGDTQRDWLHGVPRTRKPVGQRINLTWRRLVEVVSGGKSSHG